MRWSYGCAATITAAALLHIPAGTATGQQTVDDATFDEPITEQVIGDGGSTILFDTGSSLSFDLAFDPDNPEGSLWLLTPDYTVTMVDGTSITNSDGVSVLFGPDAEDGNMVLEDGAEITGNVAGVAGLSPLTVNNAGTITATGNEGSAVSLGGGGLVTNLDGGVIEATGDDAVGVWLEDGGTVDNEDGASITGTDSGVFTETGTGTIDNAGTITGTGAAGIGFGADATGTVINEATGAITGEIGIDFQGDGGTVVQRGTITGTGGTAIQMAGEDGNVELVTGSTTDGDIVHTEDAGDTVTLSGDGTGSFNDDITGFATLIKNEEGDWTFGGDGAFDSLGVFDGDLTLTGSDVTVNEFAQVFETGTLDVADLGDGWLSVADEGFVQVDGALTGGGIQFDGAGTVIVVGELADTDGVSIEMGDGDGEDEPGVLLITGSTTSGDILRTAGDGGIINLAGAEVGEYDGDITGFAELEVFEGGQWTLGGDSVFETVDVGDGMLTITGSIQTEQTSIGENSWLIVGDDDSGTYTAAETIELGADQNLRIGAGGVLDAMVNVDGGSFTFVPGQSDLTAATIDFIGDDDTLGLDSDDDFDLDEALLDPFEGFENISKSGAGTMDITLTELATNDFIIEEGIARFDQPGSALDVSRTLAVRGGASLDVTNLADGRLNMGEGSAIIGAGSIIGSVSMGGGSVMAPGDSFGTINIDGEITYEAGSILSIELNSENPAEHDQVNVTGTPGTATFEPGSIIQMIVVGEEELPDDTDFTVVTTDGGITDTNPDDIILDAPAIYDWNARIEGNDLIVNVSEAPVFERAAVGRNNQAIGTALQGIYAEDPDQSLVAQLREFAINDPDTYNFAVNTLSPEPVDAMAVTGFRTAQSFQNSLTGYLNQLRAGTPALASGGGEMDLRYASAAADPDTMHYVLAAAEARQGQGGGGQPQAQRQWPEPPRDPHTFSVFARGIGAFNNQLSETDRTGFVAEGGGAVFGADYRFDQRFLVGMSLGYIGTDITFREQRGEGEIDSFRFGPYATYTEGNLFVDTSLTFGFHDNEMTRVVFLPDGIDEARSSFDSFDLSFHIGAGYDFAFGATTLTPLASLQYTYYDQDGFREHGPSDGNLSVSSLDAHSLRTVLGGRVAHRLRFGQIQVVPEFSAGWSFEFLNDSQDITARFLDAGDPFTVRGGSPSRSGLAIGTGFSALIDHNISAYFRYDGEFASNRDVHTITGGLTLRY